jgi:hypothetical protein
MVDYDAMIYTTLITDSSTMTIFIFESYLPKTPQCSQIPSMYVCIRY